MFIFYKAVIDRNVNAIFKSCPSEADIEMTRYLASTPKAFAILGCDSDFCVFKDCRQATRDDTVYLPMTYQDIHTYHFIQINAECFAQNDK